MMFIDLFNSSPIVLHCLIYLSTKFSLTITDKSHILHCRNQYFLKAYLELLLVVIGMNSGLVKIPLDTLFFSYSDVFEKFLDIFRFLYYFDGT